MKKNGSSLDATLLFHTQLLRFQQICRKVRATGERRWENDAEHSWQLFMMCWYIINKRQLDMDRWKVGKYSSVHDLPELDAGDPCIFTDGPQALVGKARREKKAMQRLAKELREFPELHEALAQYTKQEDPESIFVYAVDKLIPFYNILLDGGKTWKQFNTTLDEMLAEKEPKIRKCPHTSLEFDELLVHLRQRQSELFHNPLVPFRKEEILPLAPPSKWGI